MSVYLIKDMENANTYKHMSGPRSRVEKSIQNIYGGVAAFTIHGYYDWLVIDSACDLVFNGSFIWISHKKGRTYDSMRD